MKPSEIVLSAPTPLVGTMGKAEAECFAAILVRTCQVRGDVWAAHDGRAVAEVIQADIDSRREPMTSLFRNPFFRPHVREFIARGFGRWSDGEREAGPVEFTEKGLTAIAKYVGERRAG